MPATTDDPIIAQYEEWMYPQPIADLAAYVAAGGRDLSDPTRMRWKLWPERSIPERMNILVAGCGANQAAVLAQANPKHRVMGIDLSSQAIAHHERLKRENGLTNLAVRQAAVEDAGKLGERFDYIVSTGVLHHLADPAAGLAALRDALTPEEHGVISVMLYSQHGRAGLYRVQEALRELGVQRTPDGVAFARDVVRHLPAWHHARTYLDRAPDLGYDAGFVDTVLNARDRAYTVPQLLDLVTGSGLSFKGWLDALYYSPSAAFPADAKIHEELDLATLSPERQWHIVDLLAQLTGAHRFLLQRPGATAHDTAESDVGSPSWYQCVPHRHPDLMMAGAGELSREFHTLQLRGAALDIVRQIDGIKSHRELLADVDDADQREMLESTLACLAEWDHLLIQRP